uniref:WH1 domain-containing protein n=1 Tax=Magallana gigas TaxID=29159 RepID=A0A8W8JLZ2_MAGGI
MGNKLCAPLLSKKTYREDQYPWQHSKDSHLLRLWAEIFRVHGDGDYMRWERVSADVVPINISCIQDTPCTVFQVTAYNKHVEKIFDVKITQPGTIICPATESFVHWRDTTDRCEWGLNFTTPTDAQRFRDCCTNPTQKFSRKANSASSLRLSPPKKLRGKDQSISSPNSPTHHHYPSSQPDLRASTTHHHPHHHHPTHQQEAGTTQHSHRSTSAPHQLSHDPSHGQSHDSLTDKKERAATIPRGLTEPAPELQTFKPIGILKPPSASSVYDNVTGAVVLRKTNNSHDASHRKSMPAAVRREDFRPGNSARSSDRGEISKKSTRPVHIETAFIGDNSSVTFKEDQGHQVSYIDTSTRVVAPKPTRPDPSHPGASSEFTQGHTGEDVGSSPLTPEAEGHQSSLCEKREQETENFQAEHLSEGENYGTSGPVYRVSVSATGVNGALTVSRSRLSASSSESPEWPSPPEPLTPMTPLTPDCQVEFDSDVLKRMLQSLPVSPEDPNTMDHGFHDDPNALDRLGFLIEEELRLRDKCVRDSYGAESYPDSGIGGMSVENAGSVWSGNRVGLLDLTGPGETLTKNPACDPILFVDARSSHKAADFFGIDWNRLRQSIELVTTTSLPDPQDSLTLLCGEQASGR